MTYPQVPIDEAELDNDKTVSGSEHRIPSAPAVRSAIDAGAARTGSAVTRKFPFAWNTAGILTGAALYTPTIGDMLLDAWIEVGTAWDGTTPLADVGAFVGGDHKGVFGFDQGPVDLKIVDVSNGTLVPNGLLAQGAGGTPAFPSGLMQQQSTPTAVITRLFPAKFVTADPIKVCVSQNGQNNGADPVSTHGAAILYLVTATPV